MSCKDCIHCSACMHTRTATLDPYQSRPTNKDTGECSDWLTTDIQEVKHGKWVHYGEYVQCSNCEHVTDDFCYDDEMTMVLPYYCSNCGAKMDLEDNKGRTINE
jgi:ssDNA-binding Zn-finger/Zn-ribbon topoisomerase 1